MTYLTEPFEISLRALRAAAAWRIRTEAIRLAIATMSPFDGIASPSGSPASRPGAAEPACDAY
ncbi:hypothetical protein GCM10023194_49500 [Planotetraspora phitsanulokensis]|uniref:Uncharacterized protein n=1 Tax=Planotetraspora phitsanulokensis TaxID=575192 RepID=A0A8J3U2D8_9ACTN|nr:hypothetical protein Pph01_19740 [Planotetraspora phitsanulokensis]